VDDARALAGHWWPEYRWDDATAHRGAFHDVLVLPGHVVARMAKQAGASTRLAVEHRTLTRLAARGRWAIPAALGNLRTADDGRAGMLTSWLPGTHRDEVAWADVAHELAALIAALATGSVLRATGALPPPRTWCGGSAFPGIVRTDLVPLLAPADGAAAEAAVTRMLSTERGGVLVHGDLGLHNILWDDSGRVRGLIDLDHAAIGDPAIDVAPLLGRFGTTALGSVVGADVLRRAMIHRATLPLQVAAAATIVGDHRLRDTALRNFTRRRADGTLHDPDGTAP
jgi:hypothetical protein